MHSAHLLGPLLIGTVSFAAVLHASAALPQPLVLLYVKDPWLMVIGSDSPHFALYDNGLVIYASGTKKPEEAFFSKRLSQTELEELLTTLDLERRLAGMDGKIFTTLSATDQPRNLLHYWVNGQHRTTEVYGPLHRRDPGNSEAEGAPKGVVDLFDFLMQFQAKGASPWLPPHIEVLIWPFDNSLVTPRSWPKGWPRLNDPMTTKRGSELYSLSLESRHFLELLELLRGMTSNQAVLIGGKKWAISYRIPFPGGF